MSLVGPNDPTVSFHATLTEHAVAILRTYCTANGITAGAMLESMLRGIESEQIGPAVMPDAWAELVARAREVDAIRRSRRR